MHRIPQAWHLYEILIVDPRTSTNEGLAADRALCTPTWQENCRSVEAAAEVEAAAAEAEVAVEAAEEEEVWEEVEVLPQELLNASILQRCHQGKPKSIGSLRWHNCRHQWQDLFQHSSIFSRRQNAAPFPQQIVACHCLHKGRA